MMNEGFPLSFDNICFEVVLKNKEKRKILNNISGVVLPGQCCAILGSSGSGKTSLLDILASNYQGPGVSGSVYISGEKVTKEIITEQCGYVMQDDSHLTHLTVRETLTYSALLRMPADIPREVKARRVEEIISELGLRNVANSRVGGGYVRGVSGGERRRVSIGVQLLKDPKVLILDEPTTGLDAFTANNIVLLLSKISKKNRTVIFTIHQPRSDIFPLLDSIMLLSQGKLAYFGPTTKVIEHFNEAGYECDVFSNPLDYFIDIVTVDKRSEGKERETTSRLEKLLKFYSESEILKEMDQVRLDSRKATVSKSLFERRKRMGFFSTSIILSQRLLINLFRSFAAVYSRSTDLFLFAFLLFMFMFRLDNSQESVQNRTGFLYEMVSASCFVGMLSAMALFSPIRNLYYRESRDELYGSFSFVTSYVLSLLPTATFATLLMCSFGYWATGMSPDLIKFLMFVAVIGILHVAGELIGTFFLGVFLDPNKANGATSLFISVSAILGSGFIRSAESMPDFLKSLSYGTIHKYSSEILVANEYEDLILECDPLVPCRYRTGMDYINDLYPGATENMTRNFSVIAAMFVLFFLSNVTIFATIKKSLR